MDIFKSFFLFLCLVIGSIGGEFGYSVCNPSDYDSWHHYKRCCFIAYVRLHILQSFEQRLR